MFKLKEPQLLEYLYNQELNTMCRSLIAVENFYEVSLKLINWRLKSSTDKTTHKGHNSCKIYSLTNEVRNKERN